MSLSLILCAASGVAAARTDYLTGALSDRIVLHTQGWGVMGTDTCTHQLHVDPLPMRIGSREFAHGIGTHAPSETIVDLCGEFLAFEAGIGIQPQPQGVGTVVFQVFVDGEKRFDSGLVREREEARPVHVPVQGAEELRLVVTDAGDGITCDCANWAEALLIYDPDAPARAATSPAVDVAPFGQAITCDPARMDGCRASRVEEFPAEDVFLVRTVAPRPDGAYAVPTYEDGRGCIGLQWVERRFLCSLSLTFSDGEPAPGRDAVELQYWAGESWWQGQWQAMPADLRVEGSRWTWDMGRKAMDADSRARGTQKVRWVFRGPCSPIAKLEATTRARWETTELLIVPDRCRPAEAGPPSQPCGDLVEARLQPGSSGSLQVSVYNGEILDPSTGQAAAEQSLAWDRLRDLRLSIRHARPSRVKSDRTVLRFSGQDASFAVAIDDVLANRVVYVRDAGVAVALGSEMRTGIRQFAKEVAERRTIRERVRAMPDQTFAAALAHVHNPVQDNGPTILSLAADNHKFIVGQDGVVTPVWDQPAAWIPRFELHPRFGGAGEELRGSRHLYGGWLPVPVHTFAADGVTYEERAFVAPRAAADGPVPLRDQDAVFVAELVATNTGDAARPTSMGLEILSPDEAQLSGVRLAEREGGVGLIGDDGRLLAWFTASGGRPSIQGRGLTIEATLAPGQSVRIEAFIPTWSAAVPDGRELGPAADSLRACEGYWQRALASAMQIEIPEPLLQEVIRSSQVRCLIAARNDDGGETLAPWIAGNTYGPLESEAHSIVLGMDLMGHGKFARRSLDFFIRRYNTQGFLTTGYTLVGTGWHLWALGEHWQLTHDRDWLNGVAPEVARVCDWIVAQRRKTIGVDATGERVPESGLLPPGVAADWGMFAYRYFNESYYCAGLRDAARALADVAYPGADLMLPEAEAYRKALLDSYAWSQARTPVRALSTGAFVPAPPAMLYCYGTVGEFFPGEDWGRTWAGDVEIGPQYLVANGVMDAHSEQADWMMDLLEDTWCLRSGMGDYPEESNRADWFNLGGFPKVQPYYGRMTDIYAQQDDVKPFIRSYFNAIPSLLNTENLTFWEHFHNMGAWDKTHETGWFLEQTRMMAVTERGKELWLAPFITSHWMEDGMRVAVTNAPTRFGPVAYTIESHASRGFIEARVEPPTRDMPEALILRLRHPEGKPMCSVTVNGRPCESFDPARECVRLPSGKSPLVVRALYE